MAAFSETRPLLIVSRNVCDQFIYHHFQVINFQRVTFDQYQQLHESCLQEYNVTGIPIDISARFNPLFYRDDETLLREINSGSSGKWDRKCPFLTWTRLSIQVSKTSGPARRRQRFGRSLSSNLYAILSGKTAYRKTRHPAPRIHYLKKILFVNTDVQPSANLRSNTGNCLRYVYLKVNQRRRFRTILSGNVGSVQTVLNYPRRRSVFKECEPDQASSNDRICISNGGRRDTFQYRLAAKIDTDTRNQPSLVAFVI